MRIHWNRVAALLLFPVLSGYLISETHPSTVSVSSTSSTTVVVRALPRVVVTTTTTLPLALTHWDTRSTDPTATWPDATDPMWKEPLEVQEAFACIRWTESRNHSFSEEIHSHAGGWYQIMPHEWWYASQHIPGLPTQAVQATRDQQSTVALWYYHRNHSLHPEWQNGCE